MASDWGQNRSLHFVSSELLNPVENCSSRRHVTLFVSSCSTFRRNFSKFVLHYVRRRPVFVSSFIKLVVVQSSLRRELAL